MGSFSDGGGEPGAYGATISNLMQMSDRTNTVGRTIDVTALRCLVSNLCLFGDAHEAKAVVFTKSGSVYTKIAEGSEVTVPYHISDATWRDFPISFEWANGITFYCGLFGEKHGNVSPLYLQYVAAVARSVYKGATYPTVPSSFTSYSLQDYNLNVLVVYEEEVLPAKPLINMPLVNPVLVNVPLVRAVEPKSLRLPLGLQLAGKCL